MKPMPSKTRAAAATTFFAIAGACGIFFIFPNIVPSLPEIILYAMILWNDYHSIEYFSQIISTEKISQALIDIILVGLNMSLVVFFNNPVVFAAIATLFFAIAAFKYASEFGNIKNPALLHRKVRIDIVGAIFGGLSLLASLYGYGYIAIVVWAILFSGTTVYLMLVRPLYKAPDLLT